MTSSKPTVSLVLGSGGARGLAHIGVIDWLTENGYEIRAISGASIGALVGGIHAAGKLPVYAEWVRALERMDVLKLLDPTVGRPGIFKGERIISVLRELVGDAHVEHLPFAYTAVATDLETGQEVWLRQGNLFDAIRASIATPMVFTPFQHGDRLLIDGAVVNPLPIAPTLDDATDLTIAVDLSGPAEVRPAPRRPAPAPTPEPTSAALSRLAEHRSRILKFVGNLRPETKGKEPSHGMFSVAMASMQAMQDAITRLRMETCQPDVLIEIPRNVCGFFEFWKAEELIALGRERAARAVAAQRDAQRQVEALRNAGLGRATSP